MFQKYIPQITLFTIYCAASLFFCSITACSKSEEREKPPASGVPRAEIEAIKNSKNKVQITITIPPGHHAYLDSGKEGNLLPILFDWKPSLEKNILKATPSVISAPPGVYDDLSKAKVLRGSGNYLFELPGEGFPDQTEFRVRTQICEEVIGQCYSPVFQNIKIKG